MAITLSSPIDEEILKLRDEFVAMPGLTLTCAQAARLLSVRPDRAAELLDGLKQDGFLMCTAAGLYRLAGPLAS
jgi:hypothetical protein